MGSLTRNQMDEGNWIKTKWMQIRIRIRIRTVSNCQHHGRKTSDIRTKTIGVFNVREGMTRGYAREKEKSQGQWRPTYEEMRAHRDSAWTGNRRILLHWHVRFPAGSVHKAPATTFSWLGARHESFSCQGLLEFMLLPCRLPWRRPW